MRRRKRRRTKKCSTLTSNSEVVILGHEPAKRSENVRVLFEERDPLEIPISTWVEYGLKDGLTLSQTVLSELVKAEAVGKWQVVALRFLQFRPRTRFEVVRHLLSKGAEPDDAELAVAGLEARGLIQDIVYAQMFVQSYQARSSRKEITWKLEQKGVGASDIEAALADRAVYGGELDAARTIAEKAARGSKAKDAMALRQRIWNRLQRKGFSRESTRIAVAHALSKSESIAQGEFLDND